ncbi:MAG TPA: hypothetical protein VK829_19760 [Terriglobales bacterium]|jgi:hypothetical protein|nr:hypothetical protein [Terriglobales bacterium]
MKALVEAVANVVLFILTPVALVWVQSRLVMAIEALAKLPVEKSEARTVNVWGGKHEQASRSCLAQATAEHK